MSVSAFCLCTCVYVCMCACLHVCKSACLQVCMSACLHISISPCFYVSISTVYDKSPCSQVSISMSPSPCLHVYRIPQTENGTNKKWPLPFVFSIWRTSVCLLQTENRKQTFVFLGGQKIKGNRRLLFQ
jgi:hypothetical protein